MEKESEIKKRKKQNGWQLKEPKSRDSKSSDTEKSEEDGFIDTREDEVNKEAQKKYSGKKISNS